MRTFTSVDDGDSGKINKPIWGSNRIRIAGKNSPEKWQRGHKEASRKFAKKVIGKRFWICPVAKDKYGRTVTKIKKVRSDRKW
jgi:endonuclease YncB( thermonuclease family)